MGLQISLSHVLLCQSCTLALQVWLANPPHLCPSPKHAALKTTLRLSYGPWAVIPPASTSPFSPLTACYQQPLDWLTNPRQNHCSLPSCPVVTGCSWHFGAEFSITHGLDAHLTLCAIVALAMNLHCNEVGTLQSLKPSTLDWTP